MGNVKLERLDESEARAGVRFDGLFLEYEDFGADRFVSIKGLLKSVDGKKLAQNVTITAILYGPSDEVLGVAEEFASADKLHSFLPFDLTLQVPKGRTAAKLCLYPAIK
jgi:hypothetical protein